MSVGLVMSAPGLSSRRVDKERTVFPEPKSTLAALCPRNLPPHVPRFFYTPITRVSGGRTTIPAKSQPILRLLSRPADCGAHHRRRVVTLRPHQRRRETKHRAYAGFRQSSFTHVSSLPQQTPDWHDWWGVVFKACCVTCY